MYQMDAGVKRILNKQRVEAEAFVLSSSSNLINKAFINSWDQINYSSFNVNVSSDHITFDPDDLKSLVASWIRELDHYKEEAQFNLNQIENPSLDEKIDFINIKMDIDQNIIYAYEILKSDADKIHTRFANAALTYKSPTQQALNDMKILYNEMNNITGNFTGYENVSVYIHGIEDNGNKFLESAVEASEDGDVIVHESRDGNKVFYMINKSGDGNKLSDPIHSINDLQKLKSYKHGEGRLHLVYETESKNEHRQKTSDDLTDTLIEMGLMNDETEIDMFAHSYGGRRSLQFAMDYPSHVRSITTIGTPYDTNFLAGAALTGDAISEDIPAMFNKNPTEYSEYIDFDSENSQTDDGQKYMNAYGDMKNVTMKDDLDKLQAANPEAYEEIEATAFVAAAGRDTNEIYLHKQGYTHKTEDNSDGAVSVKSQNAEDLGSIVNDRPIYDVEGNGITDPAHGYETTDDDFIELIRQVNQGQYDYK